MRANKLSYITGLAIAVTVAVAGLFPTSARAWGDEGHEIVARIAYARLTPPVRQKVDAILASDPDPLTAPDFVSRSTWSDRYRDSDRNGTKVRYSQTRAWHFADIELDSGSLVAACPDGPEQPSGLASAGPADSCVVRKVDEFAAELADPATPAAEKRLALKFLLHFVGDLHQPLHSADNHDAGGNGVPVLYGALTSASNLHAYWDTRLVRLLGADPAAVASTLAAAITPADAVTWRRGSAALWATETFSQARDVTYALADQGRRVDSHGVQCTVLDAAYDGRALPVVRQQLSKAGIRLAKTLTDSLR